MKCPLCDEQWDYTHQIIRHQLSFVSDRQFVPFCVCGKCGTATEFSNHVASLNEKEVAGHILLAAFNMG